MTTIQNIFGIKTNKDFSSLKTPERQSIEQTEDYATKKVLRTKELTLSDGSASGYLMNDTNGIVTGGHAAVVSPAGNNKDIQYNKAGVFGANDYFYYDEAGIFKVGKASNGLNVFYADIVNELWFLGNFFNGSDYGIYVQKNNKVSMKGYTSEISMNNSNFSLESSKNIYFRLNTASTKWSIYNGALVEKFYCSDTGNTFQAGHDEINDYLQINGATSGNIKLKVPATPTSYSLIFPTAQGAVNQYLKLSNITTGQLDWIDPSTYTPPTDLVTGTGTSGYLSKWTGSHTLGNSGFKFTQISGGSSAEVFLNDTLNYSLFNFTNTYGTFFSVNDDKTSGTHNIHFKAGDNGGLNNSSYIEVADYTRNVWIQAIGVCAFGDGIGYSNFTSLYVDDSTQSMYFYDNGIEIFRLQPSDYVIGQDFSNSYIHLYPTASVAELSSYIVSMGDVQNLQFGTNIQINDNAVSITNMCNSFNVYDQGAQRLYISGDSGSGNTIVYLGDCNAYGNSTLLQIVDEENRIVLQANNIDCTGDINNTAHYTASKFKSSDGSVGITATQTFKDGSGTTKTMTIKNGIITNIA